MLLAFRRFGQTSAVKYGLILLALSFMTWGIGDYLNGGSSTTAITVGNGEISVNELYQSYQQRKNQFSQMTGETITDETAKQMGLPNLIISESVREKLLENNANNLGLVGSDLEIARTIQSMNSFQQDGKFSADIYRQNLQLSGMTASNFETGLKKEQQQNALRALFRPQAPQNWVAAQTQINNSAFDLAIWPVTAKNLPRLAVPTEDELNDFYTARTAQYQTPEARDLTLLTITPNDFTPKEMPSDTDIEAYYAENGHLFTPAEKRTIQQVTSPDKATAENIRKKLMAGETLDNAVELGTLTATDLPEPFSSTVFALDINTYSKPLETPFGYAIAWATDIQTSTQTPLKDVRDNIVAALKEEQALFALEDALENIDDAAAGGTPLTQIATELNLQTKAYNAITFDTDKFNAETLATVFELRENETSEAIEATQEDGSDTFTFIEVKKITPPTLPALKTQFDRVLTDFTETRNQERIRKAIITARSELVKGQNLSGALKAAKISTRPISLSAQKQADIKALGWPSETFNQLLAMDVNQLLLQNVTYNNDIALLQLKKRSSGTTTPEDIAASTIALNNAIRDELFMTYLKTQEAQQKIKLYDSRLRQVFSAGENQ